MSKNLSFAGVTLTTPMVDVVRVAREFEIPLEEFIARVALALA